MVEFLNSPKLMAGFSNLTDTVRKGRTQLQHDGCNEAEYDGWVTFAKSMQPLMYAAAEFIAGEIEHHSGAAALRVLDIAAGHGLFGITIARRLPQTEVVAQDWSNVLEAAERNALAPGVSSRYQALPGDAFSVDFGADYDVVLLTNLLHHFDRDSCAGC